MGHAEIWDSHNNTHGKGGRQCRVCANHWGLIRKYGLNICRQCFREYAKDIGFVKVRALELCRLAAVKLLRENQRGLAERAFPARR
ncbi:hypothetical protein WJX81_005586 [Elliptochloris bilobata]|uniref:40S ribosomal protein S29 n=1 Tax=Elliptochloris bilobata TaxID=381761 RepID=A0AAW1RDS9_9CHLO